MHGWIELPHLFAMPGAIGGNVNIYVARCAVRTDHKVIISEIVLPNGDQVRQVQVGGTAIRTPIGYDQLLRAFSKVPGQLDTSYVVRPPAPAVKPEDQEPPKSEIIVP